MSTVSVYLMGGLGNQLFQIFTALAYSIRFKRKLVFPYSEVLTVGIARNTYWDSFLSSLKGFTTYNSKNGYSNSDFNRFVQYRESGHHYSELANIPNQNLLLFGYFQSPLYFEKEKDAIFSLIRLEDSKLRVIKDFPQYCPFGRFAKESRTDSRLGSEGTPTEPPGGVKQRFSVDSPNGSASEACNLEPPKVVLRLSMENDSITISMHFRLGDYKEKQDYHPLLPYSYYRNSLAHIMMNIDVTKKVNVFYFCEKEDNDTVSKMIDDLKTFFDGFHFIKVDDTIEDWKQMLIMSNCDHNIIANSSFSWWGAYFNKNTDKIVCYPSIWFGPAASKNNTDTMFPKEWYKI